MIRPADKGSGIVIIDRQEYVDKLCKEMEEDNSYRETEGDQTAEIHKEVKKFVNRMYRVGTISKAMKEYLIPRYPKPGRLKGNPKLHKDDIPYRTIVNGIGTATENLAEIAEKELQDFVVSSPSYIKDTTDFLMKLQDISHQIPSNAVLFCFDVVKLYPSIPIKKPVRKP